MKKKAFPHGKVPRPFIWALADAALLFLTQNLLQVLVGWVREKAGLGPAAGLLLLCLPPLACLALACWMVMQWKSLSFRESLRFMGMKPFTGGQALLGLLLSVPVLAGYGLALRQYLEQGIPVALFPTWPALLVLFVVSAGFYEELAFRGLIFQSLRMGRPFFPAAALSSLLWALSHWGADFMASRVRVVFPEIVIFLLGLAGSYVFEKSGNAVWSWMIVHLSIDAIGLVNIGNAGLFRAPVGFSMRYLFAGEAICILLAFLLAPRFRPHSKLP